MNLLRQEKVDKINADQCQFGQQTESEDPLKKPTGFMSNAPLLLKKLDKSSALDLRGADMSNVWARKPNGQRSSKKSYAWPSSEVSKTNSSTTDA